MTITLFLAIIDASFANYWWNYEWIWFCSSFVTDNESVCVISIFYKKFIV